MFVMLSSCPPGGPNAHSPQACPGVALVTWRTCKPWCQHEAFSP